MKTATRLLALLLAGVAGAGEAPPPGAPPRPREEIVEVDAVVVDASGKRLTALSRDEFEVDVDARPVALASFAPPAGPPEAPSGPTPSSADLFVFVDQSDLDWKASKRALGEIRRFARERAARGTRLLVAAYADDLRIFSPPTSDPERLERIFGEIEKLREKRSSASAERTRLLQETRTYGRVRLSPVTPGAPEELVELRANREGRVQVQELERLRDDVQTFGERELDRQRGAIASLRLWVSSLGAIPGRKEMLVATPGYTAQPTAFLEQLLNPAIEKTLRVRSQGFPVLEGAELRMMDELDGVVRQAQDARVALFTLASTQGPATQSTSELETPAFNPADVQPPREVAFVDTALSLRRLAEATNGGHQRFDASLHGRLDAAREDAAATYSLGVAASSGYAPSLASGPFEHLLVVRAKRPGLEIRHRPSYRLRTPAERAEAALAAAAAFGATANELGLVLETGPPEAPEPRSTERRVPLLVRIPLGPLAFVPGGATRDGKLSARLAVRDATNRVWLGAADPIRIGIPQADLERARGSYWAYRAEVRLPPGSHRIALVVVDEVGGAVATVSAGIDIP